MKNSNLLKTLGALAISLLALALLPWALGRAGMAFGQSWIGGSLERWQRLPDPPGPPAHLVAGYTSGLVYVETADGQVYSCDQAQDGACWVSAARPDDLEFVTGPCDDYPQPLNYDVPNPPGQVVERIESAWCHFEAGERRDYVLGEDGSVWTWRHRDASYLNLFRGLFPIACGAGLGLLGAVGVIIYIWRLWWKGRTPPAARAA
jgi:hypothetical protein